MRKIFIVLAACAIMVVCIIRYRTILIFNFPIGLGDLYIVDIVDAGSGF
ncbi:MAG: hypothetical protein HFJ09_01925 [Lachnospiraceae bacterium]|nr:hypothetical protein [Lachnospiraceae bacterium]